MHVDNSVVIAGDGTLVVEEVTWGINGNGKIQ